MDQGGNLMRIRVVTLTAAAIFAAFVLGSPAFAQSAGAGASGGSHSSAGGSSVSTGNSASSASVSTGGGANVGVIQGNVAEGSSGSGSSSAGAANNNGGSGSSTSGQSAGAADVPNAATEGVLKRLKLPAIGTTTNATPVSDSGPGYTMWGLAAAVVLGLALLYRRLPRPSSV
jgi:hypothetical protein